MYNDGTNKWVYKTGDNGVQVKSDGSLRVVGSAAVYDDIIGDIFSKKLNNTTGKVDYDWDDNFIKFQPNGSFSTVNDRVQFNLQIPHKAVIGSNSYLRFHVHHFQYDGTTREIKLRYRIQNNGATQTTTWNTISTTIGPTNGFDKYTYSSGIINQITIFPEIDITGANISSTLQIQITREDSTSGNINAYFIDAHIAIDSDGSITEWSK